MTVPGRRSMSPSLSRLIRQAALFRNVKPTVYTAVAGTRPAGDGSAPRRKQGKLPGCHGVPANAGGLIRVRIMIVAQWPVRTVTACQRAAGSSRCQPNRPGAFMSRFTVPAANAARAARPAYSGCPPGDPAGSTPTACCGPNRRAPLVVARRVAGVKSTDSVFRVGQLETLSGLTGPAGPAGP